MNKSDQTDKLAEALAKVQGELENAAKSAQNPHFKNRYADLAEVLNTIRPVASRHGVAFVQAPVFVSRDGMNLAGVETLILHADQWVLDTLVLPVSKVDAQGVGSAVTYARRYALASLFGIGQEDDDGQAAVRPASPPPAALIKAIESATTRSELTALVPDLQRAPAESLPALQKLFKERAAKLPEGT